MIPTPSAPSKTGIHWTQFPATALTGPDGLPVDWTDHRAAHQAVSRLFAPRLPGAAGERRAEAGILYRLDVLAPGEPAVVLVQSLVPPELTPALSRSTEVSRRAWDLAPGDRVAVRLSVNPVRRTTRHYEDAAKAKVLASSNVSRPEGERGGQDPRDRRHTRQTAAVVPAAESTEWLLQKLGSSLIEVEAVNHFRDTSRSGLQKLVVDTFDLMATASDVGELERLRISGIGRAKSYGCGLLTARRIG